MEILFHRIQHSWVCIFFIFLQFYIDFTSSLFNAPWAPGPKCIFFTFRSCRQLNGRQAPCRPLRGRQSPIFENFTIRHIFLKFCFFKYKNEKGTVVGCALSAWQAVRGMAPQMLFPGWLDPIHPLQLPTFLSKSTPYYFFNLLWVYKYIVCMLSPCSAGAPASSPTIFLSHITPVLASSH